MSSQYVDGAIIKLTAKDILVLMQALRIAAEEGSLFEYANQHHINQLRDTRSTRRSAASLSRVIPKSPSRA